LLGQLIFGVVHISISTSVQARVQSRSSVHHNGLLTMDYGQEDEYSSILGASLCRSIDSTYFFKNPRFHPSIINPWSRKSLRIYSTSACDNFKPQLQLRVDLLHMTLKTIQDYWRLTACIWPHRDHLCAFNSTQKWTAQLKGNRSTKLAEKENRPSSYP
jgi:hypothetical protein